jgi:hypothetical protein
LAGGRDGVKAFGWPGRIEKIKSKSARCCSLAGLKPGPYKKKQDAALKGRRYNGKIGKAGSWLRSG